MLVSDFFSWWYGQGWKLVANSLGPRLRGVSDLFSVGQLGRTLFEPWRRIISYPGASLEDKVRAWADNMFSRAIGFVVRIFVLFAALVTILAVASVTLLEIIAWPLLPLLVPGCLILAVLV